MRALGRWGAGERTALGPVDDHHAEEQHRDERGEHRATRATASIARTAAVREV